MSEYIHLIQKEKEDALRDYREDVFRLRLNQKITEGNQPSRSYTSWFRKPAIAGIAILFILFFGWLSTQIFLPSSLGSEEMRIKNTFVQLFSQHRTILNQSLQPIELESNKSAIYEFEWSVKRVIFAIQREQAPDEDIAQSLRKVLQNTAVLIRAEKGKSGELNI